MSSGLNELTFWLGKDGQLFEDNSFKCTILIESMPTSSQINVLLEAIWQKLSLI